MITILPNGTLGCSIQPPRIRLRRFGSDRDSFDLDEEVGGGESGDLDEGAGWGGGGVDELGADGADGGEGGDVADEEGELHQVAEGGSGSGQHRAEVAEDLAGLGFHVAGTDHVAGGVEGDLAGGEQQAAGSHRMAEPGRGGDGFGVVEDLIGQTGDLLAVTVGHWNRVAARPSCKVSESLCNILQVIDKLWQAGDIVVTRVQPAPAPLREAI